MKTLSEQLREFMDAIENAAPTPEQPKALKYKYKFTIPTWIPMPDDEETAWEEEREVGVNATISGGYYAGSLYEPPETPEVDIQQVYDLVTGENVLKLLPSKTLDYLANACLDEVEAEGRNHHNEPDDYFD